MTKKKLKDFKDLLNLKLKELLVEAKATLSGMTDVKDKNLGPSNFILLLGPRLSLLLLLSSHNRLSMVRVNYLVAAVAIAFARYGYGVATRETGGAQHAIF